MLLVAALAVAAGGCGTFSGLDGSSSFTCKATTPEGGGCQSISEAYARNTGREYARPQPAGADADAKPKAPLPTMPAAAKLSPRDMDAPNSGMPIRQPPLVLRVWVAPWEDEAGDLHDQSYFYTMVHSGKWMIDANRTRISGQFKPVFPLRRSDLGKTGSPEQRGPLVQPGNYEGIVQPNEPGAHAGPSGN
jgi:conjugal transfer pilus assembly protein TraV